METQPYKSTKKTTKFRQTDRIFYRNLNFYKGVVLSILVIATPFLTYLYRLVPEGATTWQTWFGTFSSGYYWDSVQEITHALMQKVQILFILLLFFFSVKKLWKFSILVPITMVLYQIDGIIDANNRSVDEYEWYFALPLILTFVTVLTIQGIISYRRNINKKITLNLNDSIEAEYESYLNETE